MRGWEYQQRRAIQPTEQSQTDRDALTGAGFGWFGSDESGTAVFTRTDGDGGQTIVAGRCPVDGWGADVYRTETDFLDGERRSGIYSGFKTAADLVARLREFGYLTPEPDYRCPGCGCEPGDGITPGCNEPNGCGLDPR